MITIQAFQANLHPRECKSFIVGHTKVLQAFDIAHITSAKTDWAFSPSSVIITIKDENHEMIGGGRIQIADGKIPLPIEDAVAEFDQRIYKTIKEHSVEGTGEFCGLWNTKRAARMGFGSLFLVRIIVAVAIQLNIKSLFALCAPSTVGSAQKIGASVEKYLGENGTFYYPKLDLVATVMKLPDISTLKYADANEKKTIFDLRQNTLQEKIEILKEREISVNYDLLIR